MASAGVAGLVRFGAFEFDLATHALRRGGASVNVPDRSLQVLALLVAKPGKLVTRKSIRQRLYPHTAVAAFERGITAAMTRLRAALSDSAATSRYIETLPKRGYRFIAPVQRCSALPAFRNYRLIGEVGRGGMGVVYKAVDIRLDREVAIKVIAPGMASDPRRRARLMREARAASALNHPNIVTVHEVGSEGASTSS